MARFFKEQDIDEFRDCFYLNTSSSGQITNASELKIIMRSLGMSPTLPELDVYLKDKGGKLSFADFLDVMHTHSTKEKIPHELLTAFEATDPRRTGLIPTRDLKHALNEWGEKLDPKETESLLRETNSLGRPQVNYRDLIRVVSAPVPDY